MTLSAGAKLYDTTRGIKFVRRPIKLITEDLPGGQDIKLYQDQGLQIASFAENEWRSTMYSDKIIATK